MDYADLASCWLLGRCFPDGGVRGLLLPRTSRYFRPLPVWERTTASSGLKKQSGAEKSVRIGDDTRPCHLTRTSGRSRDIARSDSALANLGRAKWFRRH